ncbi:MAG: Arc-like binding domain [Rhizobium sp.]|nr:Arc-like binding domain [Rhizobium sp.]
MGPIMVLNDVKEMHMTDFKIRLHPDIKEWLANSARKNLRSMNSEILFLLQKAKQADEPTTAN